MQKLLFDYQLWSKTQITYRDIIFNQMKKLLIRLFSNRPKDEEENNTMRVNWAIKKIIAKVWGSGRRHNYKESLTRHDLETSLPQPHNTLSLNQDHKPTRRRQKG